MLLELFLAILKRVCRFFFRPRFILREILIYSICRPFRRQTLEEAQKIVVVTIETCGANLTVIVVTAYCGFPVAIIIRSRAVGTWLLQ